MEFDKSKVKWMKGWMDLPEAYFRIKTPSVTTIINDSIDDPGLEEWIKAVGEEKAAQITKAAQERGTSMHIFIEEFLKSYKESHDPSKALRHTQIQSPKLLEEEGIPKEKVSIGRDLFYNFYESDYANSLLEIIGTELPIYSPSLFYRGKADAVYKLMGIAVSDFKTINKPIEKGSIKEKKYKLQLGGYALGLEHMYNQKKDVNVSINYASIISMHTKSEMVFVTECKDQELQKYKDEFENLCIEWHKSNCQSFLFS